MLRLPLICLLLGLTINSAFAQPKKIDSLRAVLAKHPQQDTFRVNRLYDLALAEGNKTWPPDNPDHIDSIATQAFQLAKHLTYPYGQANALFVQSMLRLVKGDSKNYQALLKQALLLAQQSGDKSLINKILMSLGVSSQGKQQLAYFQQALAQARTSGNKETIFDTHSQITNMNIGKNYTLALQWALSLWAEVEKDTNTIHQYKAATLLAEVYSGLKDYDQALTYLRRSQRIANKRGDKGQLGAALIRIGELYQQKKQPDKSIEALKQGLPYMAKIHIDWIVKIESLLAACYQQKEDDQQALTYAHRALARIQNSEDVGGIYSSYRPMIWLTLAQTHLHMGQLDSSLYYCNKSLPTVQFISRSGFLDFPRDVTNVLAQVYAKKGNYAKAYEYQSQYIIYKDSLNNEEVIRKTTALRFNDQMAQQRSRIALLIKDKQLQAEEARRQRLLLFASIAVLVLIVGLAVVLYRNNRSKQKANALLQAQRDQLDQALTKLKATQGQLIQKEKMASLGELTAGIAHEIQNPLNFVNNFSEVSTELIQELKEELTAGHTADVMAIADDLTQNLFKIHQHGQRASNIVKGMLEHSRSTTGDVEPTDINALAEEYLRLSYHGRRAKDKDFGCELVTNFDPVLGQVEVMAQELGRVLLNLFTNAFYAVGERQKREGGDYKPMVTVSTFKTRNGIEIRVRDNGTGMPEDIQQKIFQPFFTTKPTGEGTGLGLSLSYDVVTKGHGGALLVQSQPGEGTEFVIQLPSTGAGA